MQTEEIITYYRQCQSIKECARMFAVGHQKIRRLLIQAGEYSSPFSDQVHELWEQGLSATEIAERLDTNVKRVQHYTPYTKGPYMGDDPSTNAMRIRACRERKQT